MALLPNGEPLDCLPDFLRVVADQPPEPDVGNQSLVTESQHMPPAAAQHGGEFLGRDQARVHRFGPNFLR